MKTVQMKAPAKINLRLEITGRRPDGYHEIATVFQKISLFDTLSITEAPVDRIAITTDNPDIPTDCSNLVHRAAALLLPELGSRTGVAIHLEKNIPVGAGLGGGSSDAAATLIGISRLLNVHLPPAKLHRLAALIGADVPFFLLPAPTAFATGIGDVLQPLDLPGKLWLVLIFPGISVSTAWAYRTFSKYKYNVLTNFRKNINVFDSIRDLIDYIPLLYNDFESIVFPAHPEVAAAKNMLLEAGAVGALMSGSGSAVFGIFSSQTACEKALRALPGPAGHTCYLAHSI